MAAQVLSFFQRAPRKQSAPCDWTQQELAEFYRVEGALVRAGIRVGTDRGLSDEDEPWFIFYRTDDGEVVIHFARIDGQYIIAGPAYEEIAKGFDFTALVRNLVARHPLIKRPDRSDNVAFHPAALLVAIVGTAFFKSGEARAGETGAANPPVSSHRPTLLSSTGASAVTSGPVASAQSGPSIQVPVSQAVTILAAAMMAAEIRVDERSLSSVASEAVITAAKSLDFSDRSVNLASLDNVANNAAAPYVAAAVDSTQTVSSVLALVALLSSLPSQGIGASAPADSLLAHGSTGGHGGSYLASADTSHVRDWVIDVRLAANGAAEVEAVQLLRTSVGDQEAQRVAVIEVEKLPQVLSDLIERGAHYKVTAPENVRPLDGDAPTTPAAPPPGDSAPNVPPQVGLDPPQTGGAAPSPAPVDTTPPASATPVDPIPAKPAPPLYGGFASQELVKQFVDYFVAHTAQVAIMVQGLQVVIFDSRVTSNPGSIEHLTSMTFTFFDGSAVNLVGAQSAFLHHDGLT